MSFLSYRSSAAGVGNRELFFFLTLFLLLPFFSLPASARPTFPPIVIETYHLAPGSTDYKAAESCTLCHVPSGPPERNPYGKDVKRALERAHATTITPAILHSIDNLDSDGDGFTNAQEFAANTLPGDPNSHPNGLVKVGHGAHLLSANSTHSAGKDTRNIPSAASNNILIQALLPPHAHHPELVHFPIALFVFSLLLDLGAIWCRSNEVLFRAAFINLLGAAIFAPITVLTGLLAWRLLLHGEPLEGTILYHLIFASCTTLLLWLLVALRIKQRTTASSPGWLYGIIGLVALACILVTGYLGGILSGVNVFS